MTIDIIGAGIGGLTAAIALGQQGIKTRIFEQAEKIEPVGAGIILANNAMQIYEKLGLRKVIEEQGNHISSMNITKANLQPISSIDLAYFEKKYGVKNIAIHRGVLQQILMDNLPLTEIQLNHALDSIEPNDSGCLLRFKNGKHIQSTILIGADGIRSMVRQKLFPHNTVRNAKQVCWRGVTEFKLPTRYKKELNEAWGKADRFGFVQITENKVYWYALKSFKNDKKEFSVNDIEKYFDNYHSVIRGIVSSTKKERINTAEIADLKPTKTWHQENVCLIGDAAHATTPNMGQGACQAIEDAYILAKCLAQYDVTKAFSEFQKIRLPKAHQVVKASWVLGKIAHLSNPILIGIRNQLMQLAPPAFNRKQSEQIFQIPNV
ncbi:MAG: FAD-dependent monooxygenase [Bacteroidota bacterium]